MCGGPGMVYNKMRNKHVGANILVHRCKSIFREVFRMKVGVIGSGAISDIYLSNMIEKFDNLEVICIASKHPEHAEAEGGEIQHSRMQRGGAVRKSRGGNGGEFNPGIRALRAD